MSLKDSDTFSTDAITSQNAPEHYASPSTAHVSYHYNPDAATFHYGAHHPMKPFRLMLTDHLVSAYDLHHKMDLYVPRRATRNELEQFHSSDYIDFLQSVSPEKVPHLTRDYLAKFNIGDDCPVFDGIYDYLSIYAGASLDALRKLAANMSDIAINWLGGLHHAKKYEPSGFCYVNDIVLSILNLLRVHPRVMYIDIDLHHGDGVQEAFYTTDRVLTVSFHKYNGEFFPGTGLVDEVGVGPGQNFAVNVPLKDGIDDELYVALFKLIMAPLIASFQPSCIVQQCGADSLGYDRLGCFNLNIRAHGECVKFIKSYRIPMLVLGGGGYTPRNVLRLWCYETAVLNDVSLEPTIPKSLPSYDWFGPDYSLHPQLDGRIDNKNSKKYLESVRIQVLEQVRALAFAPLVQMHQIPPDLSGLTEEEDKAIATLLMESEDTAEDARLNQMEKDSVRTGEFMVDS